MFFLFEIIRLGLRNLWLHKLRSTLTSLGIILGVAAVIIMVAIGEGRKRAAMREIEALGATNIIVRSTKPPESSSLGGQERSFMLSFGVLRQDYRRLEDGIGEDARMVPLKAVGAEITNESRRMLSQAFGTTPALQDVANLVIDRGRYLSDEDLVKRSPVCVIGSEVADKLFQLSDPVGQTISIDSVIFRIIGVMKPVGLAGGTGSALVGRDLNLDVHLPLTTAKLQFGDDLVRRSSGAMSAERVELSEVYISARSTDIVLNTAERVRRIMEVGHSTMNDVQIIVPWELLEKAKRDTMVMNIMLTAIAAISLLVGGIGIMNIMLASVTERTREIGIRRALGATRRHILAQFLVETGTLSGIGGVVGIALGVSASVGIENFLPWLLRTRWVRPFVETAVSFETQVTLWSIVLSFVVAAGVGLAFGIYPAVIASRQDPIVALRHD